MKNSFRYSKWDGSQLFQDVDGSSILDSIADDLIFHGDITAALRRLLRTGATFKDGRKVPGIEDILSKIRAKKKELASKINPDSMFADIEEKLQEIISIERGSIEALIEQNKRNERQVDALNMRLLELDTLPNDLALKLDALKNYDFTSVEASKKFENLMEKFKKEILDAHFQDLTSSLKQIGPRETERLRNALSALNQMIEQHLNGEELNPSFEDFMAKYGGMFPGNPKNLDELLKSLAQRSAALSQLISSMSPEQQQQLLDLSNQVFSDLNLAFESSRLANNLRNYMPELNWDTPSFSKTIGAPSSLISALDLADQAQFLSQIEQMFLGSLDPQSLKELDYERIASILGQTTADDLKILTRLADQLAKDGLISQSGQKLRLTPKGMRRIGNKSLEAIFRQLKFDKSGSHALSRQGSGFDYLDSYKTFEFGDPFDIELTQSVKQAIIRAGPKIPIKLQPDDFIIKERETQTKSATVVMIDLSLSMPMRDNFLAAKKTALALYSLISQKYPKDYIALVGFSQIAHTIAPQDLPAASWDFVYGTNIAHALKLSRKLLEKQRANRQIIMITDGEPTAHIAQNGEIFFSYPPTQATIQATLREVLKCTKANITINSFILDATEYLREFITRLTEINKGRAFFTTPEELGEYVMLDFLEKKFKRIIPS